MAVAVIPTGAGKGTVTVSTEHAFSCSVFNFDINGWDVKREGKHPEILAKLLKRLASGWTASILGLASTTGDRAWDTLMSQKRAESVEAWLKNSYQWEVSSDLFNPRPPLLPPTQIRKVDYQGKDFALRLGRPNNSEEEWWRAVWISLRDGKVPPPTAKEVVQDVQFPGIPDGFDNLPETTITDIAKGLDEASMISALTVAELFPLTDMALSIIDTWFAWPAALAAGDQAAYINGFIRGYDLAMQDMADAYSDPALDKKPLSDWPPIPHPTPHYQGQATNNSFEENSKKGDKDGCEKAYQWIQAMESSPKTVTLTKGGQSRTVPLTGKQYLWTMRKDLGAGFGAWYENKWNDWLKSKGKKPYPTLG